VNSLFFKLSLSLERARREKRKELRRGDLYPSIELRREKRSEEE
jgi:hypothetical protein